ncbi:MAG: D-alanyl-D-alanine carboxypeptidase / D-alanyl-D-alanine-endopeptidase (penicillin-binding protein 4) [Bacteroidetes bacterium]|nr:MAG: D-alanyl-D-alanine carboxypeptidase / D-alanyl-D-alanine-endopeptidase (penicillin-binding protein 4) [Bacteroidota bacterium]
MPKIYLYPMKRLLNKQISVKQVAAIVIVGMGLSAFGATYFLPPSDPKPVIAKNGVKKDSAAADTVVAMDTTALGRLLACADSITNARELVGGSWSFYLVEVDSGKEIYSHNITTGLVPASVMKVVSTGTALALLGAGHHFSTSLQYDGKIDPATKILEGNIYIRGGGDPALGSETFGGSVNAVIGNWREAVKRAGIDSVAGCIIADAEAWERDPIPLGWAWEDVQSDYGIGPTALSIHENSYDLYMTASAAGVSLKTEPRIPGMKLYNQAIHSPSVGKSYAYVAGAPFQDERVVMGEVSSYLEARSAIPDPPLFCAEKLLSELKESGIGVRDSATTLRKIRLQGIKREKSERKTISGMGSPSLGQLIFHTNHVSHNFYAEAILRGLSYGRTGYGSTTGGIAQVISFWKDKGIDLRGFYMADGSGISRYNSVSTKQLVGMLNYIAKDSSIFQTFYKSLPVAGESGTISKLAQESAAEGNLRAKSGTMSRVKAYAGYVRSKSGKLMTFAMIGNNTGWETVQLKAKFERLFILMAELP